MADGMAQLLADALAAGDRKVYTYVTEGNIPSLRGCANVGFEPDHAPVDAASKATWDEAVAPREPENPPREAPTPEPATS